MPTMARETWTDERLDDLNQRVSDGFREQREEVRALRDEMTRGHEALRAEMHAGDESLRAEMQAGHESLRAEMQAGHESLRAEMQAGHGALRAEIKAGDESLRTEFDRLCDRLDRLQLIMLGSLVTMVGTLLTVILGIVVDRL